MGGMGGGHATAAGANAKGEPIEALKRSIRILREALNNRSNSNKIIAVDSTQTEVGR